jgi:FkbM family methyltransferase
LNRRALLARSGSGISGSFFVGTTCGIAVGAIGTAGFLYEPKDIYVKQSWAEQGEDLIIESLCGLLGIAKPTYLDIGAAHPVINSNTYLFYRKGCRGVLIEPNPTLCKALVSIRPGDRTVNAGIGFDDRTEADYYMVGGALMNTFSKDWIDAMEAKMGNRDFLEKVIKMTLLNINEVIGKNFRKAPDFISVDTEGLDLDILKSLDFNRFRPPIICAETASILVKETNTPIVDLMRSNDYSIRGSTIKNAIFVDNRLAV